MGTTPRSTANKPSETEALTLTPDAKGFPDELPTRPGGMNCALCDTDRPAVISRALAEEYLLECHPRETWCEGTHLVFYCHAGRSVAPGTSGERFKLHLLLGEPHRAHPNSFPVAQCFQPRGWPHGLPGDFLLGSNPHTRIVTPKPGIRLGEYLVFGSGDTQPTFAIELPLAHLIRYRAAVE